MLVGPTNHEKGTPRNYLGGCTTTPSPAEVDRWLAEHHAKPSPANEFSQEVQDKLSAKFEHQVESIRWNNNERVFVLKITDDKTYYKFDALAEVYGPTIKPHMLAYVDLEGYWVLKLGDDGRMYQLQKDKWDHDSRSYIVTNGNF